VGGSDAKKGPGPDLFFRCFFNSAFELPLPVNAQKRDKKKSTKNRFWIFFRFFWKMFSTWTFCKNMFVVFLNSPYRETPKNIPKKRQEKKVGWWVGGSGI
jgi:hypothetical protein